MTLTVVLAAATLASCVELDYVQPGELLETTAGQALVFGRIRFVYDGREYYPLNPSIAAELLPPVEIHFWLLRLDHRAISAELHPDGDGSLALRVAPGDYALVGSGEAIDSSSQVREVLALLQVPGARPAVYAGDLVFATEYREGWSVQHGLFGMAAVEREPLESVTAALTARYGPLPGALVASPWCVGSEVPGFSDAALAARARDLLDRGCPYSP